MIWKTKTLGDLCHIEKGKIGIQKATPGEFPLVVTAEERLAHNEFHFEGNAVIIPLVSSTGHGHKSLKRIHFQSGKFAVGNILCAVIPKDENILRADYLFRFLDLNREKELVSRMKGMANVTLPMKEIAKVEIPIPPIEAQIEFVQQYAVLEEKSNDLGEEITHQLDLVKQLRQAFLREAMQGKLVSQDPNDEPASVLLEKIKAEKECLVKEKKIKKQKPLPPITEDEIPFEIPENWVWCRLGDIYNSTSGGTPTRSNSEYWNGEINWFKSGELNDSVINTPSEEKITELGLVKSSATLFPAGTILIALYGATAGKLSILGVEGTTNQAVCGFYENLFIDSRFLFYQFLFWREKYVSDSWGQAQPNISQTYLKNSAFCLPPQIEQERIVNKLDKLMAYCDELVASIRESQQQNELLLQQVLREALEPKNVEQV